VLSNPINKLNNSWSGANLQVNWDLDFALLTSISGYLDYDNKQVFDYDGSLRYSDENKKYNNGFNEDLVDGFFYYQDVNKSYELQENWSGDAGMDWSPNDDLMLYGRITRGCKTGGFPRGFAFTPEELNSYDEETVWSYELGFKSIWLANTLKLNDATFYYDYQDVQGYTQRLSEETGTVVSALGNLGDAEHIGAELDME